MHESKFEGYLLQYALHDANAADGMRLVNYLAIMTSADQALAAVGALVETPTDVRLVTHGPDQLQDARARGMSDGEVREV